MLQRAFSDAVAAARDELAIEVATSADQVMAAQRLRYRVYCEERGYEPGAGGLEQDAFDAHAAHVLVKSCQTGMTLGTVRVVLSNRTAGHGSFPMSQVCEPYVLAPLPVSATGEISRFALLRHRAGISPAAAALMRLCLMRGIVEVSGRANLTHWCAVMESSLLRLLRATAIHFLPIGPTVEFHGTRQPTVGAIATILGRIRREQPVVWSFITADGTLWNEQFMDRAVANQQG